jgi:hypothetical protein
MCAMTRQAVQGRLVLVAVAAIGPALAACGLDTQGTEFVPDRENRLDAGLVPTQGRLDATPGEETSHELPRDLGARAATDAASRGLAMEAGSPEEAESTQGAESRVDASYEAASSDDALAPEASAAPSEAAASAGSSCDEDGDGHLAAGVPCLGDDCCDTDPMVHPGQTAYFASPGQCGGFDYDCDGTATPEYGVASCQWNGLGCSGDGFVDSTPCGATAPFSVCASTGLLTCAGSVGSLTQACR